MSVLFVHERYTLFKSAFPEACFFIVLTCQTATTHSALIPSLFRYQEASISHSVLRECMKVVYTFLCKVIGGAVVRNELEGVGFP